MEEGIINKTTKDQNHNGISQNDNLSTNRLDDNAMLDQEINRDHIPFENLLNTTDENEDTTGKVQEAYRRKPFESW